MFWRSAGTPPLGVPVNFTDQVVPMVGPVSADRRSLVSSQAARSARMARSGNRRKRGIRMGLPIRGLGMPRSGVGSRLKSLLRHVAR